MLNARKMFITVVNTKLPHMLSIQNGRTERLIHVIISSSDKTPNKFVLGLLSLKKIVLLSGPYYSTVSVFKHQFLMRYVRTTVGLKVNK